MPHCTVRYHVRLVPRVPDTRAMDAIGIFTEERIPDELGEPGELVSSRLRTFSGPGGDAMRALVTRGSAWDMDVQGRAGPLVWDD